MPASNNSGPSGLKVEIFKLANKLKARLGRQFKEQEEGFLAPEAIAEADQLIAKLCTECPQAISRHLETLSKLWVKMRDAKNPEERHDISRQVFTIAHEIKDLSSMCGYELIAYFAESLRDYIDKTELDIAAQVIIVQAHMDAMLVVHRQGVKKDAGPQAEELKEMVRKAVAQYS